MATATRPSRFILSSYERKHLTVAVLKHLKEHIGQGKAITGLRLAAELGYNDDRKIRLAIRQLIKEGVPVVSSVTEPPGFYICASPQEATKYVATLRARAREDLLRLKDFEEAAARKFNIPQQPNLFNGLEE